MTGPGEWTRVEMPEGSGDALPWLGILAGAVFAVVALVVYGRVVTTPSKGASRA